MTYHFSGKKWFVRWLPWIFWGLSAGWLLQLLGPVMHETDQASLLDGAIALARGEGHFLQASFYNYDKQYGTYWLLAALLAILPNSDPLLIGNLLGFILFWGSMAALLLKWPPRRLGQSLAISALFLCPAFWQHSAFLASNFVAAAMLTGSAILYAPDSRGRKVASIFLAGFATACRLDVLVLLPLLAWVLLPRQPLLKWLRQPMLWGYAAAGLVALLVGKLITPEAGRLTYELFFIPKIFAAYTLFGIGAFLLILVWWEGWTLHRAMKSQSWAGKWHLALGALLLLPYFGFYTFQMFSTRHWTVGLAAAGLLILGRRGAMAFRSRTATIVTFAVFLFSLVPLAIGIRLPFPTQPSLVLAPGTIFPTTDGELTMGGYAWRVRQMRQSNFTHDHNQPLWETIQSGTYRPDASGDVPVLPGGMLAYYELAGRLNGLNFVAIRESEALPDAFYIDSRTLTRTSKGLGGSGNLAGYKLMEERRFTEVAEPVDQYTVYRSTPGNPSASVQQLAALATALGGNEFIRLPQLSDLKRYPGHTALVYSSDWDGEPPCQTFTVEQLEAVQPGTPFCWLIQPKKIPSAAKAIEGALTSENWSAVVTRLPAYMSVQRLDPGPATEPGLQPDQNE